MAARMNVIPALQYKDAKAAIEFLCKAFGFEKKAVYEDSGLVAHAELTFGNGMIMLGSVKDTGYGKLLVRPADAGGVTMSTYFIVDDVERPLCPGQSRRSADRARAGHSGLRRPRLHLRRSGRPYLVVRDLRPDGAIGAFERNTKRIEMRNMRRKAND